MGSKNQNGDDILRCNEELSPLFCPLRRREDVLRAQCSVHFRLEDEKETIWYIKSKCDYMTLFGYTEISYLNHFVRYILEGNFLNGQKMFFSIICKKHYTLKREFAVVYAYELDIYEKQLKGSNKCE